MTYNEGSKDRLSEITGDSWRLNWHQMPMTGWMNDPNGVCDYKGEYHLYYQYTPGNAHGVGKRSWGHKVSKDLIHFTEQEIFLEPKHSYDKDGAFSGTAIEYKDKLHFFYTGNVEGQVRLGHNFDGREQNVIHVVSEDGYNIEEQEIAIPHHAFPQGYTDHIRDPKVFQVDNMFYMLLGARTEDHHGSILCYESEDLYHWGYNGEFLEGDSQQGYMWECPDYFELNGKSIMLLSPQGILATEYSHQNPHTTTYIMGKVNWDHPTFIPETDLLQLDYGFDFYAPQTFVDRHNRRILWGWMGIGDSLPEYYNPTVHKGWQHAMTMPRELLVENNILKQKPLKEYQELRREKKEFRIINYSDGELNGDSFELQLIFEDTVKEFSMELRQDTTLSYQQGAFTLKHGGSGYGRRTRSVKIEKMDDIQIFSDTSSLEIFINDGAYVLTTRVYPEYGANQAILIDAPVDGQLIYWPLKKVNDDW